ncbi:protein ARK2N [Lethenteron reissneri]|uniref:protein ARK2N n=1 Tax=Lethenteron reissneri TaxID=7753 RepID=UPI002AB7225D|nr:protein ARK2N [Lethenteron reissneri]XP_061426903.1 protein ARK2N [Lethenteron reissneri]XP_061426904.1 protein ARK2N [Lethenteron reissneri]
MEPGCQADTASVASGRGQKPWAERGDGATTEAAEVPACSVDAAPKRQGALANSQHAVPPLPAGSDMEVSQEESLPSSVAQATDDVRGAGESDAGCDSGSLSPSSSLQFGDSETGSSSEDNAAAAATSAATTAAANDNGGGGETASRPAAAVAAAARRGDDEDPTTPGRGSPSESSGGHRRPRRSRSESDPSAVASKKNRASGSPGKKVWLRRGPCQAQVSNAAGVAGAGGVGGGGVGGSGVGKRRSQQQKERLRELRRKREAAVQRKLASLPYSSSSSSSSSCSSSSSSTSRSSGGSDSDARGRVLSPAQPPLDGPPVVVYNDLSDSDSGVGKLAKKEARVASAGGEAGDQGSLALGMSTLGQDLGK